MQLENKTALITGAGRGIGRGIAQCFGNEGATLVLVARTASDLHEAEAEIRSKNPACKVLLIPGDITDANFVSELFKRVQDELGQLDILVNNAGSAPFAPVEEMPVASLRDCLELNVVAVFACTQAAIRLMNSTGGTGKIINIGSVRSHWTESGDAGAYNASKYALRGMTESIARQLHGSGSQIAVGLVCPGIVNTSLTNPNGDSREDWLVPETIAKAVLHAATAPVGVNVFDTVVIPMFQKPW